MDYDVMSDQEWEEEPEGESLSVWPLLNFLMSACQLAACMCALHDDRRSSLTTGIIIA